MDLSQFHFLRPQWGYALLPLFVLLFVLWRSRPQSQAWKRVFDSHLMRALLLDPDQKRKHGPMLWLAMGWLTTVFALAGPTWKKLPTPVFHGKQATVFVVDLAQSMNAKDQAPSRIGRVRFELQDALKRAAGEQLALVLFAEDAYVVMPLADDPRVIAQTVPILEPGLMPGRGERLDLGIQKATELLQQAGSHHGRILVFADGIGDHSQQALAAAEKANKAGFPVSILGFGSKEGAPIPLIRGRGFVTDAKGKPILARLDEDALQGLAKAGGGHYAHSTPDDRDLELLLPSGGADLTMDSMDQEAGIAAGFDTWSDAGSWFVLIPLFLALLAFRRGWEGSSAMLMLVFVPQTQDPGWVDRLFHRADQIASKAFAEAQYEQAAQVFENPQWKASALYKAGKFEEAAQLFSEQRGPEADYNRGNALARAGKLKEALAAYEKALQANPNHEDAQFNHDLVEKLLQQQDQQQQKDQGEQQDQQQQQDQSEQQQNQQQKNQEQEKKEESPEEKQAAEEQPQEISEKDQATEQWLKKIPDDPGGLLREKLRRRYARHHSQPR